MNDENPAYWLLLYLEALQGMRGGNQAPVQKYFLFVEAKRGRDVALSTKVRLRQHSKTGIFPKAQLKINELKKGFK